MRDTKRTLILMAVALVVLFGWNYGVTFLSRTMGWKTPQQEAPEQREQGERDRQAAATQPGAATGPTTQQLADAVAGATQPATGQAQATPLQVTAVPADAAQGAQLGSIQPKDATYAIGVKLSPIGG